ncbi:MAG: hypothetical protein ACHQPI_06730, partial [Thermoanaerobaculia bacterium]
MSEPHACPRRRFAWWPSTLVLFALAAVPGAARGQGLGSLVSPGPLSKAHAKLEGLENCQKCHEPGKQVSSTKCLDCHKPIAERIAAKKGVHRDAAKDCVSCHVEHAGVDADTRRLNTMTFDHKGETGFPLEGKHKGLDCAKCHKTRSFLTAKSDCTSCHQDPHAGKLDARCETCHPPSVLFKETRKVFDHSKSAYPLTGAHGKVVCEKCHATKEYKGVRFALCSDCHKDPHKKPLGTCATCHTTESFRMIGAAAHETPATAAGSAPQAAAPQVKFDHAKTGYALVGRHASVPCASCHRETATKVHLKYARCVDCHRDVHVGVFKTADCSACHKETGFKGGTFDHATKTRFPLLGKHVPLACAACHKAAAAAPGVPAARRDVDFRGARSECASCHADVHKGQLGATCATCHTADTFRVETYKHPRSPEFFGGSHAPVACEKCHGTDPSSGSVVLAGGRSVAVRKFTGVSFECAACHKDPHLGQVSRDCASCHTVDAAKFAVARFDHSRTKYPLTGKHVPLDCAKCHRKETGTFPAGNGTAVRLTGLPTDCKSCHKDVHLGQLGTTCETCHTTATFEIKTYTHKNKALAGFFVDKHATAECKACHRKSEGDFPMGPGNAVKFTGLPTSDCKRCHDDFHHGSLGNECATCHTMSTWRTPSRAFHKASTFPLEGKHLAVPCASCHWNGQFKGTPNTCFDCHWVRRQDDLYRTVLGSECAQCHRPVSWTAVMWNHAAQTGFALNAAHSTLRCDQCHKNARFAGTPTDCYSCHGNDYLNAKNPNHVTSGFPTTCETCHRAGDTTWQQGTFATHSTVFPLQGAHLTAPCAACHKNNNFTTVPTSPCSACHMADFQTATTPVNHVAGGFPTACDSCHKYSDPTWQQATFTHSTFVLAGAHATATCASCHKNSVYKGTPRDCATCHQTDFTAATTPVPHAGFPTACDQCHAFTDMTWQQKTPFSHGTYFALAGAHVTTGCETCHKNGNYTTVPTSPCASCHMSDFQTAATPVNHPAGGLPTTCDTCHKFSDSTWQQAVFTHSTFVLAGAHTTATCTSCHKNNIFKGTPRDCATCHQTDFTAATSPVAHTGFPTACDQCHAFSDPTWQQKTSFNHGTYFSLAGAHQTTPCANCHKNGNYTTVPTSPCSSCHMPDYQTATTPVNHPAGGFPTACDTCHKFSDPTWHQALFTHSIFALAGAHATATCASCHKNNVYKGTPRDCATCHQTDFAAAAAPVNHAGFPTACDQCHAFTDPTWQQKTPFNHSTYFALAGTHVTTACATCHKNGNFTTVPTNPCSACHQADFQASKNPSHVAAGFPTTCDNCHKFSDPTWLQAVFNHSTFALAGAHATAACTSCHKNNIFKGTPRDCATCHQTDFAAATTPVAHAGLPTACDQCHAFTDPTWQQKTPFNHSTYFALAGAHATTACATCHKNGNYTTVPSNPCTACHQTDFTAATTPVAHAGFPATCDQCHAFSDTTWQLKTPFNHTTYFALAGAHSTTPCANCHKNGNYTTVPTNPCSACHINDFNTATTPVNHIASSFPTTCDSCHKSSDATWMLATFSHTTFPLVGVHATTACAVCHNPPYAPSANNTTAVPTTCFGCHQTAFAGAATPVNHAGLPTTCDSCHKNTDSTWLLATAFNHSTFFALSGAHSTAPCSQCHNPPYAPSANNFVTVPTSPCSACHINDYNTATTPVNHIASSFPTTCDSCHKFSDATWMLATFSHTTFPLVGVHATTACAV